ncbi:MAG: hypothetical protein AAGA87_06995 [Pseudomonadota bacterium]
MRPIAITLTALILATPASAGAPMSAAEFEAYVTGKTLTYSSGGVPYGVEEYLSGRRVLWQFLGSDCQAGEWYPEGEMICFIYDAIDGPQCWTFFKEATGLRALFMNDSEQTELYETDERNQSLICPNFGA